MFPNTSLQPGLYHWASHMILSLPQTECHVAPMGKTYSELNWPSLLINVKEFSCPTTVQLHFKRDVFLFSSESISGHYLLLDHIIVIGPYHNSWFRLSPPVTFWMRNQISIQSYITKNVSETECCRRCTPIHSYRALKSVKPPYTQTSHKKKIF